MEDFEIKTTEELLSNSDKYIMKTYGRFPIVLVRGNGAKVWDSDGNEYLDFLAGIAVCSLGHSHPAVVSAIKEQVEILTHVSNIYHIKPQIELAKFLVENSFADKAFFCNSGAEANEAAIKLARKYSHDCMKTDRYEIITMKNSFHGRTLATVTATGQEKFHAGFDPLPEGFKYAPFDDLKALEDSITDKTCGVMVEPIQGEGGVRIPADDYLKGVREICDKNEILLILDEVQTGIGRTGSFFAYERSGIKPDIATLAKAMGNGFPVGAMLATDKVASAFVPGSHASTFGGNPLGMAAGLAVMKTLFKDGVMENCKKVGSYMIERLNGLKKNHAVIQDVRGRGLMVGVELNIPVGDIVARALKKGVLMNCTCVNVLRFLPPLIVTTDDVDRVIEVLDEVMEN